MRCRFCCFSSRSYSYHCFCSSEEERRHHWNFLFPPFSTGFSTNTWRATPTHPTTSIPLPSSLTNHTSAALLCLLLLCSALRLYKRFLLEQTMIAVRFGAGRATVVTTTQAHVNTRRKLRHSTTITTSGKRSEEDGVVVILGATGTGKSKLSIDLGTRFPSEVVNSDKIQVYRGLDITTNKMPLSDRCGVQQHLLGELDSDDGQLSPAGFRLLGSKRMESIRARRRMPIVAGGSNSFVHALLAERYDSAHDPFAPAAVEEEEGGGGGLRYRCCLLWVDVGWEVLKEYLDRRVDEMVELGMVAELEANYDEERARKGKYEGLEMAIGVPEFDRFFISYPPEPGGGGRGRRRGEREAYEAAVEEIKSNTRILARRQTEKIERLRWGLGWEMRRLDATEAVRRKLERRGREEVEEAWERDVLGPALSEVGMFWGGGAGGGRRWWGRGEVVVVGRVRQV